MDRDLLALDHDVRRGRIRACRAAPRHGRRRRAPRRRSGPSANRRRDWRGSASSRRRYWRGCWLRRAASAAFHTRRIAFGLCPRLVRRVIGRHGIAPVAGPCTSRIRNATALPVETGSGFAGDAVPPLSALRRPLLGPPPWPRRRSTTRRRARSAICSMIWRYRRALQGTIVAGAGLALLVAAGATLAIPDGFRLVIDRGFAARRRRYRHACSTICSLIVVVLAVATACRFYFVSLAGRAGGRRRPRGGARQPAAAGAALLRGEPARPRSPRGSPPTRR